MHPVQQSGLANTASSHIYIPLSLFDSAGFAAAAGAAEAKPRVMADVALGTMAAIEVALGPRRASTARNAVAARMERIAIV
jgi:hypothetical protein